MAKIWSLYLNKQKYGATIYFPEGLENTPFNSLNFLQRKQKNIYFLKSNLLWPESSKVDLEEELLEAFLIFLCLALLTTITPLANFCSLDNLGGGGGDLKKTSGAQFLCLVFFLVPSIFLSPEKLRQKKSCANFQNFNSWMIIFFLEGTPYNNLFILKVIRKL